jgi:hypothetical protein
MKTLRAIRPLILLTLLATATATARADEVSEAARGVVEQSEQAIVTVRLVVKERYAFMGATEETESRTEAIGTIITPFGLTVASLSAIDPSVSMAAVMDALGETEENRSSSEVTDTRILLQDGRELQGRVVLRDLDLDLAFIRPIDPPTEPLPCVDLSQSVEAQLLDPLLIIGRMGMVGNRQTLATTLRVGSIIRRPRTFYVPSGADAAPYAGGPVFAMDGKPVGICLVRWSSPGVADTSLLGDMTRQFILPVVLPGKDLMELAGQAGEAGPAADAETPAEDTPEAAANE